MTTQQKRQLAYWVLGAVLVPLVSWGASAYDARKLNVSDYRQDSIRDSAWKANALEKIEETRCTVKPKARGC